MTKRQQWGLYYKGDEMAGLLILAVLNEEPDSRKRKYLVRHLKCGAEYEMAHPSIIARQKGGRYDECKICRQRKNSAGKLNWKRYVAGDETAGLQVLEVLEPGENQRSRVYLVRHLACGSEYEITHMAILARQIYSNPEYCRFCMHATGEITPVKRRNNTDILSALSELDKIMPVYND